MRLKFRKPFYVEHVGAEVLELGMEVRGHKLYTFKSLDVTPKIREMMLRLTYHQMGLGIRNKDLDAWTVLMEERLNEGDLVNAASLVTAMKDYRKAYASEKLCYEMAGSVIIVDNEPLPEPTEKYNEIKKELLKDKKVRAFFLNTALRLLQDLGSKLDISQTKAYMMTPERLLREETFLSLIKSNIRMGLWQ